MNSPVSSEHSNESSDSEGEYSVQQAEKEDKTPRFDFSNWNPEGSVGVQYLGLLPVGQNVSQENYSASSQTAHVGRIKVSLARRKCRLKEYVRGAPVARDVYDEKKLRNACGTGDFNTVAELLQDGVDPCGADNKRRTALHIAAARGDEQLVRILLNFGANPNIKDAIGNTSLHLAACTSNIPVITMLLQAGTDVNALDMSGKTPLHLAGGRLRLLQGDKSSTSEKLKTEVSQIITMMKEYLHRSGGDDSDLQELNLLYNKLELSSTREELDSLGGILADFANLQIIKKDQPG